MTVAIIKPKTRGFICTTAHPEGCAAMVQQHIDYATTQTPVSGPKRVLIIGASTGYGLASRIVATFAAGAKTLGVFYERPANGKRTASAGWYNTVAFEQAAQRAGISARSINGDAFSNEIKRQTIDAIKEDFGQVDLIVYSLASPRRTDPDTGETYHSALKTLDVPFTNKTVDTFTGEVTNTTVDVATEEDIAGTIAVMGGDDWQRWIEALLEADLIAPEAKTVAYSYIGPELTKPVYRDGTIGKAKLHLEATAKHLNTVLQQQLHGAAFVAVNKAVVTQSSAAIPIVPLYISLLFKVMKDKDLHEGCIEQIYRLFAEHLYIPRPVPVDSHGLIRIDDREMRDDVQAEVAQYWQTVDSQTINTLSDLAGYRQDFFNLFGFEVNGIDYDKASEIALTIPSLNVQGVSA